MKEIEELREKVEERKGDLLYKITPIIECLIVQDIQIEETPDEFKNKPTRIEEWKALRKMYLDMLVSQLDLNI